MPTTPYCTHPQSLERLIDFLDRKHIAYTPVTATDNPHANDQKVAVLVLPDDATTNLYPQLLADFSDQGFWPTLAHPQDPQNPWYPWVDGDLVEPSTHLIFSDLRDFYQTAGVDYFTRPTATNPQLLTDPESLTDVLERARISEPNPRCHHRILRLAQSYPPPHGRRTPANA